MKYSEFIQLKNIKERLIALCDIYQTEGFCWEINHFPDFEISGYEGPITKDYYFKNSWTIPPEMESVIEITFGDQKIYHFEDFKRMSDATEIPFDNNGQRFVNRLFNQKKEILSDSDYGFDIDALDEFKLHNIKINRIDNENRKIIYEGTIFGDSDSIDPVDWAVYTKLNVKYIPNSNLIPLYIALIGESYTLYREDRHTLAFFILFSALECFINSFLPPKLTDEEKDGRLSEQINELFEHRFGQLDNNEIFQALKPKFNVIKEKRNDIAHGKKKTDISLEFLDHSYYFVLIFILSYKYKLDTFSDLKQLLKSGLTL